MRNLIRMCAALIMIWILATVPSFATVTAGRYREDNQDVIYVAGNDDYYPIEYYNREKRAYDGVIPDVLERVSKETGLEFVYIKSSESALSLAESGKVDVVSAYVQGSDSSFVHDSVMMFSYVQQGKTVQIGLAFTASASPEVIDAIKQSASSITEHEIHGYLVSNIYANPDHNSNKVMWGAICVLGLVLVSLVLIRMESGKNKKMMAVSKMTDEETGVGNLLYFEHQFHHSISVSRRNEYYMAYIIADSNYLKMYYGDAPFGEAMKYAAGVLSGYAGESGVVARISESGFVYLFEGHTDANALQVMDEIICKLNVSRKKQEHMLIQMFHAALYHLKKEDVNSEFLIFNLRRNCSTLLGTGNGVVFCGDDLMRAAAEEKQMIEDFQRGFANEEFKLYLQFIADNKTKDFVSAEALSRWEHPEQGLLFPGKYIGAMETSGAISQLDFYMLEQACRQLHKWEGTEFSNISISCNVTRITLSESEFCDRVRDIVSGYVFERRKLVIEITEDAIEKNMDQAARNVRWCKKHGFTVALDDLGSGYTALSNLCDYPIDVVKIDRDILLKTDTESGKQLFSGMIALARSMQKKIVCEGVEDETQNAFVSASDCDYIQGWYYSKVHPTGACEEFVRSYRENNLKQ